MNSAMARRSGPEFVCIFGHDTFDRERGTRTLIFFLTNPPRTLGVRALLNF